MQFKNNLALLSQDMDYLFKLPSCYVASSGETMQNHHFLTLEICMQRLL